METQEKQIRLEDDILQLNTELTTKQEDLTNLRLIKEELELKVQTTPINERMRKYNFIVVIEYKFQSFVLDKATIDEERARATEEKFQKLKTMYTQIRDEHVKLLRTHGEVSKSLITIKKEAADAVNEKENLRVKLEDIKQEQKIFEEIKLQKIESEHTALQDTTRKIQDLMAENATLHVKCEELEANKSAEIAELSIKIDNMKEKLAELENELTVERNEKIQLQETHKSDIAHKMEEFAHAQEDVALKIELKETEVSNLKDNLKNLESHHEEEIKAQQLTSKQSNEKIESLENQIKFVTEGNTMQLKSLYNLCVSSSEKMALRLASENEIQSIIGTAGYFMLISKELNETLSAIPENYIKYLDNKNNSELIGKILMAGHLLSSIHGHGITICNNTADIEFGEKIIQIMKNWFIDVKELYVILQQSPADHRDIDGALNNVKKDLQDVTTMIGQLCQKLDSTEQIADMVEKELSDMDKSVEEAAKKFELLLSQSRAQHSGIKLEVNEKILDACTTLMECIRVLVQKSRLMQGEIISIGKGSASVKEFYKRNHQWTEGLISAAKAVAQGANFLV